jgi:FRG domain-containing protein
MAMINMKPTERLSSWDSLVQAEKDLSSGTTEWVFRGESELRVPTTTLHRSWDRFSKEFDDFQRTVSMPRLEREFLAEFQRNYPIYSENHRTEAKDTIYWLSLMRHYGVPTRLLDFTFSMFVAAYFALESPVREPDEKEIRFKPSAIWAINKSWLTEHSVRQMKDLGGIELCDRWGRRQGDAFEQIFWETKPPLRAIFTLNPLGFHERLHVQQGLFLCPGDILDSFESNLTSLGGWESAVRLYLIEADCRNAILWKLRQNGTSRESLFPGLQGFAESLSISTPLLLSRYMKSEQDGNRVPKDDRGQLDFSKYPGRRGPIS